MALWRAFCCLFCLTTLTFTCCKVLPSRTRRRDTGPHSKPHPHNMTNCFEHLCWCDSEMADCSGHDGKLTFVPFINISTIEILNFSRNALTHVPADFFANLTHLNLTLIDLGHNGLTSFDPNAFRGLHTLHTVYADTNNLAFEALGPVLQVPTLVRLDILKNRIDHIPRDIFIRYPMRHLHTLNMHRNMLTELNMTVLKPLEALTNLGLNVNQIKFVYPDRLEKLRYLNLENNYIGPEFLTTCDANNQPYYPELHGLYLNNNNIGGLSSEPCLSKVYIINMSYNKIYHFDSDIFSTLHSLKILYLDFLHASVLRIQPRAFSNPSLESLYLSRNYIDFSRDNISALAFAGCPRLHTLMLDVNDFSTVPDSKMQTLLQPKMLQKVYLGRCKIQNITNQTFRNLKNVRELYLYGNYLTEIPDGAFDEMPKLRYLSLDQNRIQSIDSSTFNQTTQQNLHRLDLSHNPYHCGCNVRWFRSWLVERGDGLFADFPGEYRCKTYDQHPVGPRINALGDTEKMANDEGGISNDVTKIHKLPTGGPADAFQSVDYVSGKSYDATGGFAGGDTLVYAPDVTVKDDTYANFGGKGALAFASDLQENPRELEPRHSAADSETDSNSAAVRYALRGKYPYARQTHLPPTEGRAEPHKYDDLLVDFYLSDQACMLNHLASVMTVTVTGMIVTSFFIFLVVYKYRWHIRLAVYQVTRGAGRRQNMRHENYQFDIYVSYAPEDLHWVVTELVPVMETTFGLRLCIRDRDFPIGGNHADNVMDSVCKSKRVLLVLSPQAAQYQWTQFELALCQNYVMLNGDVLVLTLLESIPLRDVTGAILSLLMTTPYIRWGEEEDARNAFWCRLQQAFWDVLPRDAPRMNV